MRKKQQPSTPVRCLDRDLSTTATKNDRHPGHTAVVGGFPSFRQRASAARRHMLRREGTLCTQHSFALVHQITPTGAITGLGGIDCPVPRCCMTIADPSHQHHAIITVTSRATPVQASGFSVVLDVDLRRGLLPRLPVDLHVNLRAYPQLDLRRLTRRREARMRGEACLSYQKY